MRNLGAFENFFQFINSDGRSFTANFDIQILYAVNFGGIHPLLQKPL